MGTIESRRRGVAAGGDDRRRAPLSRTALSAGRHDPGRRGQLRLAAGVRSSRSSCSAIGTRATTPSRSARSRRPNGNYIPFESNQSHIGIAYPTIPYKHPDYFQAWAAVGVLSSGSSSRLFTEVRERRGVVLHRVCLAPHAARSGQRVVLRGHDGRAGAGNARRDGRANLSGSAKGIEQSELDRLKARIKSSLIMQQESTSARSGAIGPRLVSPGAGADAGRSRAAGRRALGREHQRVPEGEPAARFAGRDAWAGAAEDAGQCIEYIAGDRDSLGLLD